MSGVIVSWLLALSLPPVLCFGLLLLFGRPGYKNENGVPYSMLTMFPFELVEGKEPARARARVISYIYCFLDAMTGIFLLITQGYHEALVPLAVTFLLLLIFKDVSLAVLFSLPARVVKGHLFCFVGYGGLVVMSSVVSGLLFFNCRAIDQTLSILFIVFVAILGFGALLLFVNPRLGDWARLSASVDQDGTVTTSRPKPFILALTEWIIILISGLVSLVSLLGFALITLTQI